MSKSLGNYIGINEPPQEIFGKVMSVSHEVMGRYYEILTDCDLTEVRSLHPKEAKLKLGQFIVEQFYGKAEADSARAGFEKVFSQQEIPEEIIECKIKGNPKENLVEVLLSANLVSSKNEARRLLKQGSISFNGQKIESEAWELRPGVLKIGKRRFLKLI